MRRASVSVPANIAEGFFRRSKRDKADFYTIAHASLQELRYYLILSKDLEYIETNKETLPTDLKEDEIKKGVREQLKQQKLASKSQEWLANLAKNAKINYFVNY